MAKYELTIYGENDEQVKKYEKDHVRWGVFLKAVKLQEQIKNKSAAEQFVLINQFIKSIFVGLTDEELEQADGSDVINTFRQLLSSVNGINSPKNV